MILEFTVTQFSCDCRKNNYNYLVDINYEFQWFSGSIKSTPLDIVL